MQIYAQMCVCTFSLLHHYFSFSFSFSSRTLKRVSTRKAPVPNIIPRQVLKKCADQLVCVLTDIFNNLLYRHVLRLPPSSDWLLFLDFSSALNATIPQQLVDKLGPLQNKPSYSTCYTTFAQNVAPTYVQFIRHMYRCPMCTVYYTVQYIDILFLKLQHCKWATGPR